MGLRTIYTLLKPPEVGRDKFESYFLSKGYRVKKKLTYIKTTRKGGLYWRYKNLMKDRIIKNINQVWVSDITYFLVEGKFYYITLLMDVYSRRIIGYNADKNMYAETTCKTLEMAFKSRKIKNYQGSLIHHSDKGSQYMSQVYLNMLEMYGCKVSVADNAYENSHMERVNGTIKNDYLRHWRIENEEALKKGLARAVRNYNEFKPHAALPEKLPPSKFEESLLHLPAQKLPTVKLYTEESKI
jgi:transposase InsO family protein